MWVFVKFINKSYEKKTVFLKTLIEILSWLISSSRIFSEFDADNAVLFQLKFSVQKLKELR